jgi:hypothetical protein
MLKISTDTFCASVNKRHNTTLQPDRFVAAVGNQLLHVAS